MNYWKQFRLSTLANARVIEIFHATKLWYAARFYPIPPPLTKALQKAFFDNLINIQAKSEASKIEWLIELCVLPELKTHMDLITRLMGDQKGRCNGRDLFFTTTHYARRILRIDSPFYKESITAMTTLELCKQVLDPRAEKLFYNPIFQGELGHTLNVTKSCTRAGVYTYGQLLDEVAKRDIGSPHCRKVTNFFDRIAVTDLEERQHHLLITVEGDVPFQKVSQRLLYAQLLKLNYRDHQPLFRKMGG